MKQKPLNFQQAIIDFMKSKANRMEKELNVPGTWYFNDGDQQEIKSWTDEEAAKVWEKIKNNIFKLGCSGLRYELCPFCHHYGYEHNGCYKALKNPICVKCGYGKRHGICIGEEGHVSQYKQILQSFEDSRISMYKFFSNEYYVELIEKIEKENVKAIA
ncbi:MAG: hypothetical protein N3F66_11865 [Spirochaetes bacterium]|nr:hypothetical protein [Spirochaetota bacterium]